MLAVSRGGSFSTTAPQTEAKPLKIRGQKVPSSRPEHPSPIPANKLMTVG